MKKKLYSIYIIAVSVLFTTGCARDLETEGISRITSFPVFTLEGEEEVFVEVGSNYSDPGATATEEGEQIDVVTSVTGTYFAKPSNSINTTIADKYQITYSAVNKDGFPGSTSRVVWVAGKGDLVNSIEGLYLTTVTRNGAGGAAYTDNEYVIISKTGPTTYAISDGIGGYYEFGRGYGPAYAAPVTVTANNIPANSFSAPVFTVGSFGGEVTITSFTVDPATKTITFASKWVADASTTYDFVTTLKQVDF